MTYSYGIKMRSMLEKYRKALIAMAAGLFLATTGVMTLSAGAAKPVKEDRPTTIQSGELKDSAGNIINVGFDNWGYNYQAHMFKGGYCDAYRDASWCQPYKDVNLIMKWNDAWLANTDANNDGLLDRHYGFDSYIGSGAWITNHQSGTYTTWDVSGDWVLDFAGGTDNREFRNLVQDEEGNVTGEFWYLSGGTWLYGGTLSGSLVGNELQLDYERPSPLTYTGEFIGTVEGTIITGGTFTDNKGNDLAWTATGDALEVEQSWNYFTKIVAAPADATEDGGMWYTSDGTELGPVIWNDFAIVQEVYNDTGTGEHGVSYRSPYGPGVGFGHIQ